MFGIMTRGQVTLLRMTYPCVWAGHVKSNYVDYAVKAAQCTLASRRKKKREKSPIGLFIFSINAISALGTTGTARCITLQVEFMHSKFWLPLVINVDAIYTRQCLLAYSPPDSTNVKHA